MTMAPRGRLIAIASGKGGVGKTWLAITLAHALARLGCRALLLDGDLGLANVDVQLGLVPEVDLGVFTPDRRLLDLVRPFAAGGFDIVAGRSGSGGLSGVGPAMLTQLIEQARAACAHYQFVLLDLSAGIEPNVRRMAAAADQLLVITTDEPTSLTDAYAVLKLHGRDVAAGPASIVVNQCRDDEAGRRTYAALRRACGTFLGADPPLAGLVHRDERVRDAIRRQLPLLSRYPASTAGQDVERLARSLL
ncbi:MAG TPA: AAA family ATPase [Acetobacteraceae bacterium]|nr:AAA family ATPase [Acetobacteraceae bacterium]